MTKHAEHGTTTMYRYGCRCGKCKEAKAKQRANYKARKKSGAFVPEQRKKPTPLCMPIILCMSRDFNITQKEIGRLFGINAATVSIRLSAAGFKRGKNSNQQRTAQTKRAKRLASLEAEILNEYSDKYELLETKANGVEVKCRECGARFVVTNCNNGIACRSCEKRAKEEAKRLKEEHKKRQAILLKIQQAEAVQVCEWCGVEFHAQKKRKYCSTRCAERHNYRAKHPKEVKTCAVCGKEFESYTSKNIYCSNECCRKANHKHERECGRRTANHRHRARMYGVAYEPGITLQKVYQRDKGICYLCGCKTSKADSWYTEDGYHVCGDTYPTIDHVIPMAKGGGHTWGNVRLACRQCNSIKSDHLLTAEDMPQVG